MNFDIKSRTIFHTIHGSHAYGLNIESSDEDYKGVCIPPKEYFLGFSKFEQYESMQGKTGGIDEVIYNVNKFCKLAADCNPSIIEILFVDESCITHLTPEGKKLLKNRDLFISKKAKHTFSGYAHAQIKRMKSHRHWLLEPPHKPTRKEFGLPEHAKINASEFGAIESFVNSGEVEISQNVLELFVKERSYRSAKNNWEQYNQWKQTRNHSRYEREVIAGYDTKNAMHCIRLLRMANEILSTGTVNVKRSDRDELLAIRSGTVSYEDLLDMATKLQEQCDAAYETSNLPHHSDMKKIEELVVGIVEKFNK